MGGNTECKDCAHYTMCASVGKKCSEYMSNAVVSGALEGLCLYNEGVSCADHNACSGCGWHPQEAELRKKELRQQAGRGETPHVSIPV